MWHQMRQQKVYVLEPKDREGMDPGLFSGSSPVFFWKDWGKPWKISFILVGLWTKI